MKKLLFAFSLLFIIGCKEEVRFKPMDCYALPEPEVLSVEVVNGVISGKSKDNVIINWYNIWAYVDELKKHCGIKDYRGLAKELGVPERYVKAFLSEAIKHKPATMKFDFGENNGESF